jgi:hydrogenase maturation factor
MLRNYNQVDVVRHQAVRLDTHSCPFCVILQQGQIHAAIEIREEYFLMVIAALCDVVRTPRHHHSCSSCHTQFVWRASR